MQAEQRRLVPLDRMAAQCFSSDIPFKRVFFSLSFSK